MAYHSAEEMKKILDSYPEYRDKLYCRGFLITNSREHNLDNEGYPFYSNWRKTLVENGNQTYSIYVHKDTYCYDYTCGKYNYFLVGHAYDPFNMKWDEDEILKDLADAREKSEQEFWEAVSNLTGVFCLGYIYEGNVVFSTDCAGMQLVYHGVSKGKLYITSHSKLVADLLGFEQDTYIKRLVSSRFWHYWGTWLPGDRSPYLQLKRMQPNCAGKYSIQNGKIEIQRYYPFDKIEETKTEEEYQETIKELGRIMSNTMQCIANKWPDKKVSISVTGGRDSMTALSCTNGNYDKFSYFSYISNYDESVDADAAKQICDHLDLEHELYEIPEEWDGYKNIDVFKKIMECNAGCIGENNYNDLKKRMYFSQNPPCDIEVKSWVNEMGRGWNYNKYNKKQFPKCPTPSYWRSMHKVYIHPWLIRKTDKIFSEYLKNYYNKEVFDKISWVELYSWEFAWSGGEGVFLTSEHKVSNEITIPFNNRKYVEKMLTVPLEKRIADSIPKDIIACMEPRIVETGIVIKDISHTNIRALIVRIYLEIFSRIHIWG